MMGQNQKIYMFLTTRNNLLIETTQKHLCWIRTLKLYSIHLSTANIKSWTDFYHFVDNFSFMIQHLLNLYQIISKNESNHPCRGLWHQNATPHLPLPQTHLPLHRKNTRLVHGRSSLQNWSQRNYPWHQLPIQKQNIRISTSILITGIPFKHLNLGKNCSHQRPSRRTHKNPITSWIKIRSQADILSKTWSFGHSWTNQIRRKIIERRQ